MGESRNRTGTAYALTVFTAIDPGRTEDVRAIIDNVPRAQASPLARLKQVHLSRLQIFDKLVYQGPSQKPDKLNNDYLVFTAVIDRELDKFLDDIIALVPEADQWWRHCVAYPGFSDPAAFKKWIRHNQRHTSLFAVASPGQSVQDVQHSLALREQVLDFAIKTQGLSAEELQQRFNQTFVEAAS
jgi:hypothetical protein